RCEENNKEHIEARNHASYVSQYKESGSYNNKYEENKKDID
ncbi:40570_t:CDS:1, partial [Gigaspora margarita]